jgi:hypothetical protein
MMARRGLPRAMDTSFAAETYDTLRAIPSSPNPHRSPPLVRASGKESEGRGPPFFLVLKYEFYDFRFLFLRFLFLFFSLSVEK